MGVLAPSLHRESTDSLISTKLMFTKIIIHRNIIHAHNFQLEDLEVVKIAI